MLNVVKCAEPVISSLQCPHGKSRGQRWVRRTLKRTFKGQGIAQSLGQRFKMLKCHCSEVHGVSRRKNGQRDQLW